VDPLTARQNYRSFEQLTRYCKTHVPTEILQRLDSIKEDDRAVKRYGIELATEMCKVGDVT
jgi:methylenetetrahydrofolate reductase (NADPH)